MDWPVSSLRQFFLEDHSTIAHIPTSDFPHTNAHNLILSISIQCPSFTEIGSDSYSNTLPPTTSHTTGIVSDSEAIPMAPRSPTSREQVASVSTPNLVRHHSWVAIVTASRKCYVPDMRYGDHYHSPVSAPHGENGGWR
ncbi:hypothetical protein JAAARDRAFT_487295 [Jaapia argillacea MUCL 33604]|uniref:Uncharacterized protein n=1 Tax=Jaapia argillacea MUCL 33604 TaxID=933084 RepID=A0A067PBY3_9AGAM|nr:hypothetical protein JAAARDRAFT_487295 [Jaapia argillacea MUCL 33604]